MRAPLPVRLTLARPERGHRLAGFARAGFGSFLAGMLVAGTRVGDVPGWWSLSREALRVAHVRVALVGFATRVAVGVSTRVFPRVRRSRRRGMRKHVWARA